MLPVLLVSLAVLLAGEPMEGVRGNPAPIAPAPNCPINCTSATPTCCVNYPPQGTTFPPVYFCANTVTDDTNCGSCGNNCVAVGLPQGSCCKSVCRNLNSDPVNCGKCGNKCKKRQTCTSGVCKGSS